MDFGALTTSWAPSVSDIENGWSVQVRFEVETFRSLVRLSGQDLSTVSLADAQSAKILVELKRHLSIRMQNLLRSTSSRTAYD